jgi:hypothetical protein
MQALSQLSYGPKLLPAKCSGELVLTRPTYAEPLVVERLPQRSWSVPRGGTASNGREAAAAYIGAINSDCVDLIIRVQPTKQAFRISTSGVTANRDDVSMAARPFALDADKPVPQVEDQVVASPAGFDTPTPSSSAARVIAASTMTPF